MILNHETSRGAIILDDLASALGRGLLVHERTPFFEP